MNVARGLTSALVLVSLLGAVRAPALRPYEVLLYGTIRAIDARHGLVTIAYAPLDTAPGGIRAMRVRDPATLRDLERGDPVEAIADTRRSRWVVRGLHRLQ